MSTELQLDKDILATYYGNHNEDIAMMLSDYLEKHEQLVSSLVEAKGLGHKELREKLHYHSSVFAYIGLPTLTEEFKVVEQLCINEEPVDEAFDRLLEKVKATKVLVEKEYEFYTT